MRLFKGVVPLRAVKNYPTYCLAETSCGLISVKIFYEMDQLMYEVGQEVGKVSLRTCIPEIVRKYKREGDYAPDVLKVDIVKTKYPEAV